MDKLLVTVEDGYVKFFLNDKIVTRATFLIARQNELVMFIRGYILTAIDDLRKTEEAVLRRTQGG